MLMKRLCWTMANQKLHSMSDRIKVDLHTGGILQLSDSLQLSLFGERKEMRWGFRSPGTNNTSTSQFCCCACVHYSQPQESQELRELKRKRRNWRVGRGKNVIFSCFIVAEPFYSSNNVRQIIHRTRKRCSLSIMTTQTEIRADFWPKILGIDRFWL